MDSTRADGFAKADGYGIGEFTASLLPDNPEPEDVLQALHLWEMPQEAYPPCNDGVECNYILYRGHPCKEKTHTIHVYLRKQAFVTYPPPCGKSYFSLWASAEYTLGPVENPHSICLNQCVHKGYNHPSAMQAWGEAKIMAGWADKAFTDEWCTNFKLYQQPERPFPPLLS